MQPSRLITRFTVRRLMVAVAVIEGTLAFLVSMKGAYWAAFANIPLRFTVLDDATGLPIANAIVRLPGSSAYQAPPTDDDGNTTVLIKVMCSGEAKIGRRTRYANFSPWRIRVLAPGYKTSMGSLEDRTRDPRFHEENPDPPPIVIRMEREP
jgi:hypothetical protein